MPRQYFHPWFDRPNSIWWNVQVMKLFVMRFPPAYRHCFHLRSKLSLREERSPNFSDETDFGPNSSYPLTNH
jgi:hypothetical protein